MSHVQQNPDQGGGPPPPPGPIYQGQFDGYSTGPGDLMHGPPDPGNQPNHWPHPYDVMPNQAPSQLDNSSNKMVYDPHHNPHHNPHHDPHHVHMMPHQSNAGPHGWYDHQGSHMMNDPYLHNQHQPHDPMMMMGYHHGHQDLSKNPDYLMQPNQVMQQPHQMMQMNPNPPVMQQIPIEHHHHEEREKIKKVKTSTSKTSDRQKQKQIKLKRTKVAKKTKPSKKVKIEPASEEENWSVSVDEDGDEHFSENFLKNQFTVGSDESDSDEERTKISKTAQKISSAQSSKKKSEKAGKSADLSKLDDNAKEVVQRFKEGCECHDQNCFEGLDPETVSRHRLNIAELSKLEHDMYLMGVTMSCLDHSDETHRQTERKRLRAKYKFMGKEVCLNAFLYLDNTTLHQLKIIRKHVKSSGVTPRIHGNHRKKPHNLFSLDIYQNATRFLQSYFEVHSLKDNNRKKGLIYLASVLNCKKIHSEYIEYCRVNLPDSKTIGYSTFRHFIKEQFPNLRFQKDESGVGSGSTKTSLKPD